MENKLKQDGHKDPEVDLNEPNEVSFAAQEAGVSIQEYKDYAKAAGTSSRAKIAAYIAKHKH